MFGFKDGGAALPDFGQVAFRFSLVLLFWGRPSIG